MFRRVCALGLWAYFGWYLTGFLALAVGAPAAIAPAGGALMALLVLIDWRQVMTTQPTTTRDERIGSTR